MEANLNQPVPEGALEENLRRAKGWLVFVGVMTIIAAGLGAIFSLLGLVGVLAGAGAASGFAEESWPPAGFGAEYLTAIAVMFIFGIVCSAIALWSAVMLLQAASHVDMSTAGAGISALIGYTGRLRKYFVLIGVNMILAAASALVFLVMILVMAGKVGSGFVP